MRVFFWRKYGTASKKTTFLCLLFFVFAILIERVHLSSFDASIRFDFYINLALIVVAYAIGYRVGSDDQYIDWILRRAAFLCALLSVYCFFTPDMVFGAYSPTIAVGYPMRLFIVYGFCWYFYDLLRNKRLFSSSLIGVVACFLEILSRFHKPIIFSVSVAAIFIIISIFLYEIKSYKKHVKRISLFVSLAIILFVSVNFIFSNIVSDYYITNFYEKYLHESSGELTTYNTYDFVNKSFGYRVDIWGQALTRFKGSPFVGSGFGQSIDMGVRSNYNEIPFHNGYIDLILSVGLLGTLPFMYWLFTWFKITLSKDAFYYMNGISIPIISFVVSIAAFNFGSTSRMFYSLSAYTLFLMGLLYGNIMYKRSINQSHDKY